jgi:hypothetical protein
MVKRVPNRDVQFGSVGKVHHGWWPDGYITPFPLPERTKARESHGPSMAEVGGEIFKLHNVTPNLGLVIDETIGTEVGQGNIACIGYLEHFAVWVVRVKDFATLNGEPWVPFR